ncbi:MAG: RNA pseudouridine synthase, partial [Bacteroidales bacterium]|nr:RNA pseudouridine synthase [Bacteroidales bacterium]
AVNKTVHHLVQKDKTGDLALDDYLKRYIKDKYNKPGEVYLGIPHRLDRPVSGVVVYTRTSKALSRMNELFRNGEVKKTYWAIVKDRPGLESDTLVHYMMKNQEKNKSFCYASQKSGTKRAELDYNLISRSENYFLLEVDLKTGRHHQIRAQLAKIGSPIRGDLKYGYKRSNPDGGISLHARSIEFIHPVKKEPLSIVAPPPTNDNLWTNII